MEVWLHDNFVYIDCSLSTCLCSVWADADTWFERQQQEEEMKRLQTEQNAAMKEAERLHREKVAAEKNGETDEADPMAVAEAQAVN